MLVCVRRSPPPLSAPVASCSRASPRTTPVEGSLSNPHVRSSNPGNQPLSVCLSFDFSLSDSSAGEYPIHRSAFIHLAKKFKYHRPNFMRAAARVGKLLFGANYFTPMCQGCAQNLLRRRKHFHQWWISLWRSSACVLHCAAGEMVSQFFFDVFHLAQTAA